MANGAAGVLTVAIALLARGVSAQTSSLEPGPWEQRSLDSGFIAQVPADSKSTNGSPGKNGLTERFYQKNYSGERSSWYRLSVFSGAQGDGMARVIQANGAGCSQVGPPDTAELGGYTTTEVWFRCRGKDYWSNRDTMNFIVDLVPGRFILLTLDSEPAMTSQLLPVYSRIRDSIALPPPAPAP